VEQAYLTMRLIITCEIAGQPFRPLPIRELRRAVRAERHRPFRCRGTIGVVNANWPAGQRAHPLQGSQDSRPDELLGALVTLVI
jgi:hypothetical protein